MSHDKPHFWMTRDECAAVEALGVVDALERLIVASRSHRIFRAD
jgi:hypothetical protein